MQGANLGDCRPALGKIVDHLLGHIARKGRHALIGHAVIGGKDRHHGVFECGFGLALPARHVLDQKFHLAERSGGFCQLRVTRPYRRNRRLVPVRPEHQEIMEIGEGLGRHGRSRIRVV